MEKPMTNKQVKEVEIILHMQDGTRLYGLTKEENVIETIVENVVFSKVMDDFAEEERQFIELIQNEPGTNQNS